VVEGDLERKRVFSDESACVKKKESPSSETRRQARRDFELTLHHRQSDFGLFNGLEKD